VYVCVCMCMYVYVCVCMCMYVYVCVCMCMYVYVCMYVCMCIYIICVCVSVIDFWTNPSSLGIQVEPWTRIKYISLGVYEPVWPTISFRWYINKPILTLVGSVENPSKWLGGSHHSSSERLSPLFKGALSSTLQCVLRQCFKFSLAKCWNLPNLLNNII